ncbi:ATP-binding protein [Kribbella sp. VKM Ac-2566]|uniref:sensor histidine kinase n=1 Tax=Kribbella sp. VKM Ac-2566 TaxID=2512218 RepID=UPI0010628BAF
MVGNLVDNAIAYNRPGGRIDITTGRENGQAVLRIGNSGAVVTPEQAHRLLQPFVRGDGAHDGDISITARPTGGLDITLRFPRNAQLRRAEHRISARLPSGSARLSDHRPR